MNIGIVKKGTTFIIEKDVPRKKKDEVLAFLAGTWNFPEPGDILITDSPKKAYVVQDDNTADFGVKLVEISFTEHLNEAQETIRSLVLYSKERVCLGYFIDPMSEFKCKSPTVISLPYYGKGNLSLLFDKDGCGPYNRIASLISDREVHGNACLFINGPNGYCSIPIEQLRELCYA